MIAKDLESGSAMHCIALDTPTRRRRKQWREGFKERLGLRRERNRETRLAQKSVG